MKTLDLGEFVIQLRTLPAAVRKAEERALREGAEMIEQEAKDLIGTEYAGWEALADSTVAEKQARGQTGRISPTDPLYATGELRATISHEIEGNTAVIGSPDPISEYHEYGTSRMPPRPIFAPAAHRKAEDVAKGFGKAVERALAGELP